ncbi:MAG TPA: hydroxyisourate hydrolase [Jatrophihabitans sp.]|nr:hydroxyisourate hydrolase [Jatrophihabitans sp.]
MEISTHVLDLVAGRPAAAVTVTLSRQQADGGWRRLAHSATGADGRLSFADLPDEPASYRLSYDSAGYFAGASCYPEVSLCWRPVRAAGRHHLALAWSPFGFSTYQGS